MSPSPAPWKHETRSGDAPDNKHGDGWGRTGLWSAEGKLIFGSAGTWDGEYEAPGPEDQAIIEAGPDLLKACKAARKRFSAQNGQVPEAVWRENYAAVKALEDAIAKAEDTSQTSTKLNTLDSGLKE